MGLGQYPWDAQLHLHPKLGLEPVGEQGLSRTVVEPQATV